MIRVMLDSDELSALSSIVPLCATYSDLVPHPAELRARLAPATLILIDRGHGDPSGEASVIDVERYLYNPDHARPWLEEKEAHGVRDLTVYADRSTMPVVIERTRGLNFSHWIATLDGQAVIDGYEPLHHPTAVQCLGTGEIGVHADLSLVFDSNWHPATEPQWLTQARNLAQAVLSEAQHADGSAGQLASLLSQLH